MPNLRNGGKVGFEPGLDCESGIPPLSYRALQQERPTSRPRACTTDKDSNKTHRCCVIVDALSNISVIEMTKCYNIIRYSSVFEIKPEHISSINKIMHDFVSADEAGRPNIMTKCNIKVY